jgi:hypothetical protein
MFGLQHKEESYLGSIFFSFLLKKNEERKAHNMLSLMLDPRFKTLHLVSSLIGHEQGKAIIEEYDKKSLFPMFLKCYYYLHPLVEFEKGVINQRVEKDKSLDIFEMTINTSEPTTKLVNKELQIFKCIKSMLKTSNVHCNGGKNMKTCFLQLVFLLDKS